MPRPVLTEVLLHLNVACDFDVGHCHKTRGGNHKLEENDEQLAGNKLEYFQPDWNKRSLARMHMQSCCSIQYQCNGSCRRHVLDNSALHQPSTNSPLVVW